MIRDITNSVATRLKLLPRSTPVPNWFFDKLLGLPGLRGSDIRGLFFLWRKTVGWRKASDLASVSQMQRTMRMGRSQAVQAMALWTAPGSIFSAMHDGPRGMCRVVLNEDLGPDAVVARIADLIAERNQSQYETSPKAKPVLRGFPHRSQVNSSTGRKLGLTESKQSQGPSKLPCEHESSLAGVPLPDDSVKTAAMSIAKSRTDPRHRQVIEFYAAEFEKRHPGLKAPLDASDGKRLQLLLREQHNATGAQITGWLLNAFNSDPNLPPLRAGFRLREFCAHALKYTAGPLKRGTNGRRSTGGAYHSGEPGKYDHIKPDLTIVVS
jgi:hypothetical protein